MRFRSTIVPFFSSQTPSTSFVAELPLTRLSATRAQAPALHAMPTDLCGRLPLNPWIFSLPSTAHGLATPLMSA